MRNPLRDLVPARYRKRVYAGLSLAALVVGAVQAADGDWLQAAGAVLVSLTGATASSNTDGA